MDPTTIAVGSTRTYRHSSGTKSLSVYRDSVRRYMVQQSACVWNEVSLEEINAMLGKGSWKVDGFVVEVK